MEKRIFTLDEANELLPYLSGLLAKAREKKNEVVTLVRELENAGVNLADLFARTSLNDVELRTRSGLSQLADEVNSLLQEIQDMGCLVKDIDQGLLDFYGVINGEEIFLCWKYGESEITHWHKTTEGFAQRKSLLTREILSDVSRLH